MTAVAVSPSTRTALPSLAGYETMRVLRNPVFELAVLVNAYAVYDITAQVIFEADELPSFPAGFLGGITMIGTCWLTQSLNRTAEALDVTPTAMRVRTTALCVTAALPLTCAALGFVFVLLVRDPQGPWTYGAYGATDRAAVDLSQFVLPALGGPLLGVAIGRWFRPVWVGSAAFLVILAWIELTEGLYTSHQNSQLVSAMRLFAPFAFFTASDDRGKSVETWRGSPVAFLGWQVCLCALAVVVALLYRADPVLRRRLFGALCAIVALLAGYYLALTGGLQHAVVVFPGSPPQPL